MEGPIGRWLYRRRNTDDGNVRIAAWHARPKPILDRPHHEQRYVVLDVETSGVDMRHDSLIAIGAVAVRGNRIDLGDAFACVLRQDVTSSTSNILIHGIGAHAQANGEEPAAALLDFLDYVGHDPVCAFRAEFDHAVIERALGGVLRFVPRLAWLDLAVLLPAVYRGTPCDSLDEWMAWFGLSGDGRHDAIGDAFATAQLLLLVLAAAERLAMPTTQKLLAMQRAQQWLGLRR